jgi:hypothetical protein
MKIKKIKPMFTGILTTAKKYSESIFIPGSSLVDPSKGKETLQEYQKVISVGPSVTEIKVGDIVCINPNRYAVYKYAKNGVKDSLEEYKNKIVSYNFNIVNVNGEDCLLLDTRDIDFVIEEYEE